MIQTTIADELQTVWNELIPKYNLKGRIEVDWVIWEKKGKAVNLNPRRQFSIKYFILKVYPKYELCKVFLFRNQTDRDREHKKIERLNKDFKLDPSISEYGTGNLAETLIIQNENFFVNRADPSPPPPEPTHAEKYNQQAKSKTITARG